MIIPPSTFFIIIILVIISLTIILSSLAIGLLAVKVTLRYIDSRTEKRAFCKSFGGGNAVYNNKLGTCTTSGGVHHIEELRGGKK